MSKFLVIPFVKFDKSSKMILICFGKLRFSNRLSSIVKPGGIIKLLELFKISGNTKEE